MISDASDVGNIYGVLRTPYLHWWPPTWNRVCCKGASARLLSQRRTVCTKCPTLSSTTSLHPFASRVGSPPSSSSEIASLTAIVEKIRRRKNLLSSTVASSPELRRRLSHAATDDRSRECRTRNRSMLSVLRRTQKQKLENLYRMCVGVTTFRVHDPDPHAVDGGHVLGVRLEAFEAGSFSMRTPKHANSSADC